MFTVQNHVHIKNMFQLITSPKKREIQKKIGALETFPITPNLHDKLRAIVGYPFMQLKRRQKYIYSAILILKHL